jgi:hypothetical protein
MATLEQLIDEARALSAAEKLKLRQELDRELKQPERPQTSEPAYQTNERERAWIDANRDEYMGQLVALDGDRLLAHGTDARKVYEAARAQGVEAPYLERVEPKADAFVGGWQ